MSAKIESAIRFVAAALAVATLPATAANLVGYYPVDSFWYAGGVPYTTNAVYSGGAFSGAASLDYSGGLIYGNTIDPTGGVVGGAFKQDSTIGPASLGSARLVFGTTDPLNNANSAFTYAAWVYTPVGFPATSVGEMLLSKFSANTAAGCEFKILLRSGDLQFITISGASTQVTAQTAALSTVGATTAGAWNHVAVTAFKPSASQVTWGCYINGTAITVNNATQNISSSAGTVSMNLGMTAGGNTSFAPNGVLVDEIRFYDGVLSQAEIISIVPEPSAISMLALGGGLLLLIRRRS